MTTTINTPTTYDTVGSDAFVQCSPLFTHTEAFMLIDTVTLHVRRC